MFCLLGCECGSQRRVIDALSPEDVEKVPMEALNFAEGPRIALCEMLPKDRQHHVVACVESMDAGHVSSCADTCRDQLLFVPLHELHAKRNAFCAIIGHRHFFSDCVIELAFDLISVLPRLPANR